MRNRQITQMNDLLDRIIVREGLASRSQARQWLRERRDAVLRSQITHGQPAAFDRGTVSGTGKHITVANPQRKLISDTGHSIPVEERPSNGPKPVSPLLDLPRPLGFQAALDERRAKRPIHRTTKRERQHAKARGIDPDAPRNSFGTNKPRQTRPKQTEPKPDTDSRVVYEILRENAWNRQISLQKLKEHPRFVFRFPEQRRRQKMIGAQLTMIIQRYGPDSQVFQGIDLPTER